MPTDSDDPRDRGRAVPLYDELVTLDLPPHSTGYVYSVLRVSGPLTHSQIADATGYKRGTVEQALSKLRKKGLLAETNTPATDHYRQFYIDPDAVGSKSVL